jgi:hypothetical protein
MRFKIWQKYFDYGCVSLAQKRYAEAVRDFRKALIQAELLSSFDPTGAAHALLQTRTKLVLAVGLFTRGSDRIVKPAPLPSIPVVTFSDAFTEQLQQAYVQEVQTFYATAPQPDVVQPFPITEPVHPSSFPLQ